MIDIKKVSTNVKMEIILLWLEDMCSRDNLSKKDIYLISKISEILLKERS